jgi:hypothetical protein
MIYSNDSYHVLVPSSYPVKSQILVGWRLENKTKNEFYFFGDKEILRQYPPESQRKSPRLAEQLTSVGHRPNEDGSRSPVRL